VFEDSNRGALDLTVSA